MYLSILYSRHLPIVLMFPTLLLFWNSQTTLSTFFRQHSIAILIVMVIPIPVAVLWSTQIFISPDVAVH